MAHPQNFWDLLPAHTQHEKQQILHGDQTTRKEYIYTVDVPPALAKIFGDTNANVLSVCSIAFSFNSLRNIQCIYGSFLPICLVFMP